MGFLEEYTVFNRSPKTINKAMSKFPGLGSTDDSSSPLTSASVAGDTFQKIINGVELRRDAREVNNNSISWLSVYCLYHSNI